jgi:hypothetical protein
MPQPLLRQYHNSQELTVAINTAVSSKYNIGGQGGRGFVVQVPVVWETANIAFEVSDEEAPTNWYPLYTETGSRVQITGIDTSSIRSYIAPPESWAMGAYRWMRLVSVNTSTGANENQTAARTLIVKALV